MPLTQNPFRKTVLVVEDESDTAEMLAEMIHLSGYEVTHAYTGQAALELTLNKNPALILLDIILPDISGLEVLRQLKRDPRLQHIPVMIISGNSQSEDIEKGIQAGASIYLVKPVGFKELKEALDSLLKKTTHASE